MIIDVSQVITNEGAEKVIDGELNLADFSFNGQNIHFTAPVSISGSIRNISGILYLALDCKTQFATQCGRCLDDVEADLDFSMEEKLSKITSDEDVIVIDSSELDLDELVIKNFCSELPINYICSEDCKGLCHVCGCNLNHTTCDCEDDYIDPRLAALKNFLK